MSLSNSFRLDDDFNNRNVSNPHYIINIIVKEYEYNNVYYNISYTYNFIESSYMNKFQNSLYKANFNNINEDHEGDIVYKNKLTKQMIEYLIMNDNELKELIGTVSLQKYRINIIQALSLFWD